MNRQNTKSARKAEQKLFFPPYGSLGVLGVLAVKKPLR